MLTKCRNCAKCFYLGLHYYSHFTNEETEAEKKREGDLLSLPKGCLLATLYAHGAESAQKVNLFPVHPPGAHMFSTEKGIL